MKKNRIKLVSRGTKANRELSFKNQSPKNEA